MSIITLPRNVGDLPDGILKIIIEHLAADAQRNLSALCLVNRRMNTLADPILYKSIQFDEPKHHLTFSKSLVARPRRGSLIQNVRLDYPNSELEDLMRVTAKDHYSRVDSFSQTISSMSNLETLVIAVPETLCHGIGMLFNGPFDLACLKSCTLYYQTNDGGYWDLQENIHIFSHPTLESLTIRRAKLDDRGFESLEKPSQTALQRLHLIECDINDDALSDLLFLPEELKEILITQLEVPSPPLEESAGDVGDYIYALQSAQHSLESITINFPTLTGKKALRMRDFVELKTLRLRDFQLFGSSSSSPRLHSVGLPPKLETLEFFNQVSGDEEVQDLLCYTIENVDMLARRLREMVIFGGEAGLPPKITEACTKSEKLNVRVV